MVEDPGKLVEARPLPVARRGYDRDATDALIKELEERLMLMLAERDHARARIADLEQQVAEAAERKHAVAQALILASQVRSESERDVDDLKAQSEREVSAIRSESNRKADEILQAAEADAKRIVEEARTRSADLERELLDAGRLAEQTRFHLTAFVHSLRQFRAQASAGDVRVQPADRPGNDSPPGDRGSESQSQRAGVRRGRRRGPDPRGPQAG